MLWFYAATTNHFLILWVFDTIFCIQSKWNFIHNSKLNATVTQSTIHELHEIFDEILFAFHRFSKEKKTENEATKYFPAKSWFNCMVSKVIVHFRTIKNIQLNDIIACELIDFD